MKNPVYFEYRRSTLIGALLVVLLSIVGAAVHYLRSVDNQVTQHKATLTAAAQQLDSEFTPVQAFIDAVGRASLLKLALPALGSDDTLPLLRLSDGETLNVAIYDETNDSINNELMMLQLLQPYFYVAREAQPQLSGMYYISAQGYAYNGSVKWADYTADQFRQWFDTLPNSLSYSREPTVMASFLPQQAVILQPLYVEEQRLGYFVFALSFEVLMTPIYQQYPQVDFLLLDGAGKVVTASLAQLPKEVDAHLLQIQRLTQLPWSLALLEQKTSVFSSGVADFVWHWISYLVLLAVLLYALQYRFRRKTLSPVNRLTVHIDRLARGQMQGVRRIPYGWDEVFHRVSDIRQRPADSE